MKISKLILTTIPFLLALMLFSGCQNSDFFTFFEYGNSFIEGNGGSGSNNSNDVNSEDCYLLNPSDNITDAEIELLNFMREEEKLARDVYIFLYDQYGVAVFNNIARSEQQHMGGLLCLLDYYELDDPASDEYGVFNNDDLQALYNSLIDLGQNSLEDALTVGATIEDVDIQDLLESLELTDNPAIITVLENLTCGSRNHLRAFVGLLDGNYTPQYITQEMYDDIIGSDPETCGEQSGNGTVGGQGGNGTGDGSGNSNGGNGNGIGGNP